MYKNIMFDLDGTLVDSGRSVMGSVGYALEHFGYFDQPREKLRTFIGPSLYDSFVREYGMSDEDANKAVGLYREVYEAGKMYDVDIYEGIPELLKKLKEEGKTVMVITSKPIDFSRKILARIGLDEFIDHQVGPDMNDNSSDKKRLIDKAVEKYGLNREECIMIGDTKYDILGAVGAKVDSIGVTYGYGSERDLREAGATFIASGTAETEELINRQVKEEDNGYISQESQ